ncbi:MAG: hypothetical protein PHE88_02405 [Elusimicrobia bacterium]|nr:hypothetical protein [Elusimicrobiota bacterium]
MKVKSPEISSGLFILTFINFIYIIIPVKKHFLIVIIILVVVTVFCHYIIYSEDLDNNITSISQKSLSNLNTDILYLVAYFDTDYFIKDRSLKSKIVKLISIGISNDVKDINIFDNMYYIENKQYRTFFSNNSHLFPLLL